MKQRLQFGSAIIEINGNRESNVLLTISKERFDEDAVQISIPPEGARALASLLKVVAHECDPNT